MQWIDNPALRLFCTSFLYFITAGAAFAQGIGDGSVPPIEIVRLKWQKEVRLPRNFDPAVIPTGGTFSDPGSRTSVAPSSSVASDATRAATSAQSAAAGSNSAFPATPGRLPVFYVYSLRIRNIGPKVIEGVAWDYVFVDPISNREVGKHSFLSYAGIPMSGSVSLKGELRSPPTMIVRASDSAKVRRPRLIEKAAIKCVLYADETVWRNPEASDGVCEFLKRGKSLIRPKHSADQPQ